MTCNLSTPLPVFFKKPIVLVINIHKNFSHVDFAQDATTTNIAQYGSETVSIWLKCPISPSAHHTCKSNPTCTKIYLILYYIVLFILTHIYFLLYGQYTIFEQQIKNKKMLFTIDGRNCELLHNNCNSRPHRKVFIGNGDMNHSEQQCRIVCHSSLLFLISLVRLLVYLK